MFGRSSATRALRRLVVPTRQRLFSTMRTPATTTYRIPNSLTKATTRLLQPSSLTRALSTTSEPEASPYAAEFSALLKHLQSNQGKLDDAYWEENILQTGKSDNPERLRYLASRLRDSIAVPKSIRPHALALWDRVLQSSDLTAVARAETHTEVAIFLQQHGGDAELDTAVVHLQQAIDTYQKEVDGGNQDATAALAAAHMHLALLHQQNKNWTESLAAFTRGVRGQIAVLGINHGAVADTYQNMGHLHGQLQQFDQAADCYRKALEIYKQVDGEQHASVAGAYHNLGMAIQYKAQAAGNKDQQALGQFIEQTLEAMQKALQIRHTALGPTHVDTAASHMALAQFLSQLQQPQAADEHYRAAADIWQALVDNGSKTPNDNEASAQPTKLSEQQMLTARRHLATVYNNKGATQHGAGQGQAALEDYTKAQQALQPMFGDEQQGVPPSLMLEWAATHNSTSSEALQSDVK